MGAAVLVVDDMKINIDMLTNILRDSYSVMAAISGENAIKLLERRKPDLVLLDVSMPGISGFDVLKYMKERQELANIPVIFVTGEHDAGSEEKGLAMGAVDYIKKPFNASIIRVKVRNHLELKSYRDDLEVVVQERTSQLAASREAIIMGMSLMSEIHDMVTGGHIMRIKAYTRILAEKVKELYPELLDRNLIDQIALYSPLHDVGKIGISDMILKKIGRLTSEEFEIMKNHTIEGAKLLRNTEQFLVDTDDMDGLKVAIEIAECHHERYDGSGYPNGIKGDDIPISARIVMVVDIYDALRNVRNYKPGFSHERSVDIILNGDKTTSPLHFDPKVMEAFRQVHHEFQAISEDVTMGK